MGNCGSKKDCLAVINAIKGDAKNGFSECTSSNNPDILPVGKVNRLVETLNSAVQATKSQKEFIKVTKLHNRLIKLMFVCFFVSCIGSLVATVPMYYCKDSLTCWSAALSFMGK